MAHPLPVGRVRPPRAVAGLGALAAAGLVVLGGQGLVAYRRIGHQRWAPPYQDGRLGPPRGLSLRLAVLGDSAAAGLGAEHPGDTVGRVLAEGLHAVTGRPVVLTNHAVIGARSADLHAQVTRCLSARPHVAVILIGANDVSHLVPRRVALQHEASAIQRLAAAGVQVVMGNCPDLSALEPVDPPLRWVVRRSSAALAAAQLRNGRRAGAVMVDLHAVLRTEFRANRATYFSVDRFHPSGTGYRRIAEALFPGVLEALARSYAARPRPALPTGAPQPHEPVVSQPALRASP
jgi:lysophospholipase L1-like esterase